MTVQIRDALVKVGYDARCVNGECYDIHQGGRVHYLSAEEGESLAESLLPHPVDLMDYATNMGLNLWYRFPADIIRDRQMLAHALGDVGQGIRAVRNCICFQGEGSVPDIACPVHGRFAI